MFRPTHLATLLLVPALLGACFVPTNGVQPVAAAPDPREEDPWFASGRAAIRNAAPIVADRPAARNVILFVGDGMGIATVTAARILEGQRMGGTGEEHSLSFDAFPHVALSKTYNVDAQVSDSASTMTATVSYTHLTLPTICSV